LVQVFSPADELFSSISVKFFLMAQRDAALAGDGTANMVQ